MVREINGQSPIQKTGNVGKTSQADKTLAQKIGAIAGDAAGKAAGVTDLGAIAAVLNAARS